MKLLQVFPDLADTLEPEQAKVAREAVIAPAIDLSPGRWERDGLRDQGSHVFGAIVVSGLLTRHLDIGGHPALDLCGPGDMIGARDLPDTLLPSGESWTATVPTRLAILDDRFLLAARRWPRLVSGLFNQTAQQYDRLLFQLVIAEQPRVEDRLLALLWHLADRFGHVTSTGVVISLGLTHEALGRLIGAQRPTVTLALRSLGERGAVERRKDRSWLVIERPGDIALTAATLTDGCQPVPLAPPEMNGARPSEMNGARPSEMNGARPSEMDGAQPV